jgi:DNA topoisomerase-1
MSLLIVESPAKARKIQKFLAHTDIKVLSSFGHINNLDTSKLDEMISSNFTPIYKNSKDKSKVIKELKLNGTNKHIILAADDDREGDAIAWHCGNLFKTDYTQKNRITFNEISKSAIEQALAHKHTLNMNSVESQRCRQLIDLMIGFKLSPLLWRHIQTSQKGLSAGRVQSTLLRMLQDHETIIKQYEPEYSYDCNGTLHDVNDNKRELVCEFHILDEYYDKHDFVPERVLSYFQDNRLYDVGDRHTTQEKRSPPQPFITSTLQQTAQNELGFPIKMTMDIAQKLYENGKITYMRTDSTYIAPDFKELLKGYVTDTFGSTYYRAHKQRKVKGAQEAHECIRPTNLSTVLSDSYKECDKKLYQLILKRTCTSHMKPAIYDVCKIRLTNDETIDIGYYESVVKSLTFEGFLKYSGQSAATSTLTFDDITQCRLLETEIKESESNPPQYYNESTIVKKLESSGIGRPSTYASIIGTLYTRNYTVVKDIIGKPKEEPFYKLDRHNKISLGVHKTTGPTQKKRIVLTDLGETVLAYLLQHFSNMICIDFTARVERDLDLIGEGTTDFHTIMKKVYDAFNPIIQAQMKHKVSKKDSQYIGEYEIKTGKYGPYVIHKKKIYGLTNYLKMTKGKLEGLTEDDISKVVDYPKTMGQYQGKDIILLLGPYGVYMKYDSKNYKINKVKDHSISSLISLLR